MPLRLVGTTPKNKPAIIIATLEKSKSVLLLLREVGCLASLALVLSFYHAA